MVCELAGDVGVCELAGFVGVCGDSGVVSDLEVLDDRSDVEL